MSIPNTQKRRGKPPTQPQLLKIIQSGENEKLEELIRDEAIPNKFKGGCLVWATKLGNPRMTQCLINAGADVHHEYDHAIFNAVFQQERECIEILLNTGEYSKTPEGHTLEFSAHAALGNIEKVKGYLQAGIPANTAESRALIWACSTGQNDIIKLLLQNGAKATDQNSKGLVYAAMNGHLQAVKTLLEHKADPKELNQTALTQAVEKNHPEVVKTLLEHLKNSTVPMRDLIYSTNKNHREVLEILLNHRKGQQHQKDLLLQWAAKSGSLDTFNLLLQHGANPKQSIDRNPLENACKNNRKEIVNILIGLEDYQKDDQNITLHAFCCTGQTQKAKELLEQGKADQIQPTTIEIVCKNNHLETLNWILGQITPSKKTLEDCITTVCKEGNHEIVERLLKAGIDLRELDETLLRDATINGHTKTVKALIDGGADICQNESKILAVASGNNQPEIIIELLKAGADPLAYNHHILRWSSDEDQPEVLRHILTKYTTETLKELRTKKEFSEKIINEELQIRTAKVLHKKRKQEPQLEI